MLDDTPAKTLQERCAERKAERISERAAAATARQAQCAERKAERLREAGRRAAAVKTRKDAREAARRLKTERKQKESQELANAYSPYAITRPLPGPTGKRRPMTPLERVVRHRAKIKAQRIASDPAYAAAHAEKAANHARIAALKARAQEEAQNWMAGLRNKLAAAQATGTAEEIADVERKIATYRERLHHQARGQPLRDRRAERGKRAAREAAGLPPRIRRKRAKTPEEVLAKLNGDKSFF